MYYSLYHIYYTAINFITTIINMRSAGLGWHKLPLKKNYLKLTNQDKFYEWFVGFTDAEGNFSLGIDKRNKNINFNFQFRIGLHKKDLLVLNYIKDKLNCGQVTVKEDIALFSITNKDCLQTILFPIFDNFSLNTTKHLDYLNFKQALNLIINAEQNKNKEQIIKKILNLKNNMNKNRINFELPLNHIKITPYWLLGLIEGDGSFFLIRKSMMPCFSITLTAVQKPVLEAIKIYLLNQLDQYSYIKGINTKLINISFESSKGNIKAKYNLKISQIDYLYNKFIPFLDCLEFKTVKYLDFQDFKLINKLLIDGKHFYPKGKSFILTLSKTMNNLRNLTSNKISIEKIKYFLNLPALTKIDNEGRVLIISTKKCIRQIYIIKITYSNGNINYFSSIKDCSKFLNVSRATINNRLNDKGLLIIRNCYLQRIKVYFK